MSAAGANEREGAWLRGAARMNRPVYLDYAATTPVDPRVAAAMAQCLTQEGEFGNPASASHDFGDAARALVEAARAQVAAGAGASPDEVVWTSGATEANNLAIFGVAQYYREYGRHIVTARTEHKAVLDPCRELERRGWRVTYLAPDSGGVIHPDQVAAALQADTVLVSIMHVNNEIGVIQDISSIGAICARHGGARLHVDAAQSIGKRAVDFAQPGVDLMSLSAHKVYGPKGVGALLVSRRGGGHGHRACVQLTALQFGGGQERGLRAGTVATHQVVGMGLAFELARAAPPSEAERIALLRERLWQGLASLGGIFRNGDAEHSVPHVLNVSFEGVEGESLLAAVRARLAVSTGSACSSALQEPSYVLRALGRDDTLSESSLRFGLGRFTSERDIDTAVAVVTQAVSRLRRLSGP
jgi:cysteine desulfurase